jgi:DNA-binding NarL/FixJ family response regulator
MTAATALDARRAPYRIAASIEADDERLGRDALRLLAPIDVVEEPDADLVLLLASGDAPARLARVRDAVERCPDAPVVTTLPDDCGGSAMRDALRAGAHGIVLDGELATALVASVHAVLAGQLAVPRALRRRLAPRALSYREKEILGLVVQGYTNQQIAKTLFLAQSTVKTHLSSAFTKLEARSRAEAAALILDPEEGYGPAFLAVAGEAAAAEDPASAGRSSDVKAIDWKRRAE